ncbi:hypothetical protein CANARDRAFT_8846 [[Candida] arabinofermentans NRRL YB-2248]|uniref:Zn(2)-C6 fungal-type domain-containing protein n=1 Tax=[Candida] arabinofermentans NRRL YB-2248 TaxID=983967 RepID=A0A1E4SXE5_9ASCO|nr:hypothetical protein CANARDRAFT_8846 [[Candida] arabinofermentans NRRL YB-2248]
MSGQTIFKSENPAPKGAPSNNSNASVSKSRSGCLTCKRCKIKCDETKPQCRNCTQKGVYCGGYSKIFKFKDTQSKGSTARVEKSSRNSSTSKSKEFNLDVLGTNSSTDSNLSALFKDATLSITGKSYQEIVIENHLTINGKNPNLATELNNVINEFNSTDDQTLTQQQQQQHQQHRSDSDAEPQPNAPQVSSFKLNVSENTSNCKKQDISQSSNTPFSKFPKAFNKLTANNSITVVLEPITPIEQKVPDQTTDVQSSLLQDQKPPQQEQLPYPFEYTDPRLRMDGAHGHPAYPPQHNYQSEQIPSQLQDPHPPQIQGSVDNRYANPYDQQTSQYHIVPAQHQMHNQQSIPHHQQNFPQQQHIHHHHPIQPEQQQGHQQRPPLEVYSNTQPPIQGQYIAGQEQPQMLRHQIQQQGPPPPAPIYPYPPPQYGGPHHIPPNPMYNTSVAPLVPESTPRYTSHPEEYKQWSSTLNHYQQPHIGPPPSFAQMGPPTMQPNNQAGPLVHSHQQPIQQPQMIQPHLPTQQSDPPYQQNVGQQDVALQQQIPHQQEQHVYAPQYHQRDTPPQDPQVPSPSNSNQSHTNHSISSLRDLPPDSDSSQQGEVCQLFSDGSPESATSSQQSVQPTLLADYYQSAAGVSLTDVELNNELNIVASPQHCFSDKSQTSLVEEVRADSIHLFDNGMTPVETSATVPSVFENFPDIPQASHDYNYSQLPHTTPASLITVPFENSRIPPDSIFDPIAEEEGLTNELLDYMKKNENIAISGQQLQDAGLDSALAESNDTLTYSNDNGDEEVEEEIYSLARLPYERRQFILNSFDKYTSKVMCIHEDSNRNPWLTKIIPIIDDYPILFDLIGMSTCFHLSRGDQNLKNMGVEFMLSSFRGLSRGLNDDSLPLDISLASCLLLSLGEVWDRDIQVQLSHLQSACYFIKKKIDEKHKQSQQAIANNEVSQIVNAFHPNYFNFLFSAWQYMNVTTKAALIQSRTDSVNEDVEVNDLIGDFKTKMIISDGEAVDHMLGVAQYLFTIMDSVIDLVTYIKDRPDDNYPEKVVDEARLFQSQLINWRPPSKQQLKKESYKKEMLMDYTNTAESFRCIVLILLQNSFPQLQRYESCHALAMRVKDCLGAVDYYKSKTITTHVYQLFIASCEAYSDEEHQWFLNQWDLLYNLIWADNIKELLLVIKEVWKRKKETVAYYKERGEDIAVDDYRVTGLKSYASWYQIVKEWGVEIFVG